MFDLDLLGIDPTDPNNLQIVLAQCAIEEYGNLAGRLLGCPLGDRPSLTALQERYNRFCQQVPNPYRGQA
jgi:hypothetical protein